MGNVTDDRRSMLDPWPSGESFEEFPLGRSMTCRHSRHLWRPPTDVFECEDAWVIKMEICGLRKKPDGELLDAQILAEKNTLTIRGNRVDSSPDHKCAFHQMEIHYGWFELTLSLEAPFDRDNIQAVYRDGFLEVRVPKAKEQLPPSRRVQVES